MKNKNITFVKWLVIGLFLVATGCNKPSAQPEPDLNIIVAQTQTAIAINHLLTATSAAPLSDPTPTVEQTQPINPTVTAQIPTCDDKVEYVGETIPDGSIFNPNESFKKEWTLRNVGTCTWTPGYSIAFHEGDKMGDIDKVTLSESINPGDQLTIQVPLIAPQNPGDYQGFWMLQNEQMVKFGLGENSDVAFWVKIKVTENGNALNLGTPDWSQAFDDNKAAWYLGPGENISFDLEDNSLVMTAFEPAGDQWRVAQAGYLEDFYIEADFSTGDTCQAKDSYGLLVRAPDQPDNLIDSGYVFVVSCDGNYRVYLMKNGQYNGLINWQQNPSINAGANKSNRVGIKAVGAYFQLYINDTLVAEFEDSTYLSGYFGLSVRSESTLDFKAYVHEISYWLLE